MFFLTKKYFYKSKINFSKLRKNKINASLCLFKINLIKFLLLSKLEKALKLDEIEMKPKNQIKIAPETDTVDISSMIDIKNQVSVFPRWATIITVTILITIAIGVICFFIAPAVLKSDGSYHQDCSFKTSCSKTLALECIRGKCDCNSDKFYAKGCQLKKGYLQHCNGNSDFCTSHSNLVCLDGMCKCDGFQYWNGELCAPKQSFNESCQGNDIACEITALLYCDISANICVCGKER